jgi:hypothetical protein
MVENGAIQFVQLTTPSQRRRMSQRFAVIG